MVSIINNFKDFAFILFLYFERCRELTSCPSYFLMQVLDEKLVAEKYLRSSGIDYTIVRPGGLKAKPPTGALQISAEDTLNSGEISRDLGKSKTKNVQYLLHVVCANKAMPLNFL